MRGLQNRTMSIERFMGCGYTYHVIGTRLVTGNSHMITTDNINLASAVAMSSCKITYQSQIFV